jgi:hypothetical protein
VEASTLTLLSKSVWTLMELAFTILSAFRQANYVFFCFGEDASAIGLSIAR